MKDMQTDIMKRIKAGELAMRPRWHFLLKTSLLITGTILAALLSIYLMSFVMFILRQSGIWVTPGLGLRGVGFFILASPWLLITLTLLFLGTLFLLVKHYALCYTRPLLYSLMGVVGLALLGSFVIINTAAHERIGAFSERHALPGLAPLYRHAEQPPEGLYLGTVLQVSDTGFILQEPSGAELTIIVIGATRMPPSTTLETGAHVAILGDKTEDAVTALRIKNIRPDQPLPGFRRQQQPGQVIGPVMKQRHEEAAKPRNGNVTN